MLSFKRFLALCYKHSPTRVITLKWLNEVRGGYISTVFTGYNYECKLFVAAGMFQIGDRFESCFPVI